MACIADAACQQRPRAIWHVRALAGDCLPVYSRGVGSYSLLGFGVFGVRVWHSQSWLRVEGSYSLLGTEPWTLSPYVSEMKGLPPGGRKWCGVFGNQHFLCSGRLLPCHYAKQA